MTNTTSEIKYQYRVCQGRKVFSRHATMADALAALGMTRAAGYDRVTSSSGRASDPATTPAYVEPAPPTLPHTGAGMDVLPRSAPARAGPGGGCDDPRLMPEPDQAPAGWRRRDRPRGTCYQER